MLIVSNILPEVKGGITEGVGNMSPKLFFDRRQAEDAESLGLSGRQGSG